MIRADNSCSPYDPVVTNGRVASLRCDEFAITTIRSSSPPRSPPRTPTAPRFAESSASPKHSPTDLEAVSQWIAAEYETT